MCRWMRRRGSCSGPEPSSPWIDGKQAPFQQSPLSLMAAVIRSSSHDTARQPRPHRYHGARKARKRNASLISGQGHTSPAHESRAVAGCKQHSTYNAVRYAVQCRTVPIYTYTYASSGWRIRRDERASASCCLVACLLQAAAGCPLRKGLAANRVPWSATRLAAPRLDFDCGYDSACAGGIGANGSGTTTKLATASSYQEPPWPRADGPSSSCLVLCRDSATQRGPNERT